MRYIIFCSLVALPSTTTIEAQAMYEITSKVDCVRCVVELQRIAQIDEEGAIGIAGPPVAMARAVDGRSILIDQTQRIPFLLDATGRVEGQIGRRGGGPGEFEYPRLVMARREGGFDIIDPRLQRRTTLRPDGTLMAVSEMNGGFSMLAGAIWSDSSLITNGLLTDADGMGFALQELDTRGQRMRIFDEVREPLSVENTIPVIRVLANSRAGTIWSAKPYTFEFVLLSAQREPVVRLKRSAPWASALPSGAQPTDGVFDRPPTATVRAIWEDAHGLLWVISTIPDERWRPGPSFAEWREKRTPLRAPHEFLSSVVDVIDPVRGVLVSTRTVRQQLLYSVSDGIVASYREDAAGTPVVELWQLNLKR